MECILDVFCVPMISCCSLTSLSALQSMLNICETFAEATDIKYNCKKCTVIRIGLRCKYNCEPSQLCGVKLLFC